LLVESEIFIIALSGSSAVAWICLIVGVLLIGVGAFVGLLLLWRRAPAEEQKKLDEARQNVEFTRSQLTNAGGGALESVTAGNAAASAQAAKSALDQVQGIVSSLPENLRFAGLLVLVGTVLISVATIQFGGVSLF
jgi:hypothetical protein